MRRAGLLLVFVVAIAACVPTASTPDASSSTSPSAGLGGSPAPLPSAASSLDMSAALLAKPLPYADAFALTRAVRGRDGQPANPFEPVRTTPPNEPVGTTHDFWTYDFAAKKNVKTTTTLRIITDHAKWWVANDATVDLNGLRTTASTFENKLYPTDRRLYGQEWSPGIDGDPRINVVMARIPGAAAGYFSGTDEEPLWVNEFSAEREMIYINALSARPGTPQLDQVIAHEFCHMIQFNTRRRSAVWFNEGQAQLCEEANSYTVGTAVTYFRVPDTQLTDWSDIDAAAAHYGEAFTFLEYLRQQAGGEELIRAMMAKGIDTPADIDAILQQRGQPGLEELFADFIAANALIGTSADARYTYPSGAPSRTAATAADADRVAAGATLKTSVHQYAGRYVELPRASIHVRFDGVTSTRLIPTDPHSGKTFWWSDKGDGMDSTLTKMVDLTTATAPKVSFWTWFDVEPDYDYGYVEASTDGGAHWSPLRTEESAMTDPNGQNLGNGLTGESGGGSTPAWVQLTADLSAYAGKQIELRFEYVTDGNLNLGGVAIDDIEITGQPLDDAESDNGWTTSGFVRSTNIVSQRYIVQVLRFGDRATVERHLVEGGQLQLDIDASGDRRPPLLAVTGLAVRTTLTAPFTLAVDSR
jgi:immune inhibitor A